MASKPTTYLNWTDGSATKVTQPPSSQLLSGWTAGQPIPFQYLNYNFYLLDQWVQYLDGIVNSDVVTENASQLMRLINGGNWSYVASTGTITWSAAFNLAVPGIADADNQAAAGSISLSDGQIAYVTANIPFNSTGTTASGSNQVTGLTYTTGIVVGQTVTGTGIPSSTTVTAISGTTITISNNATANGTVPLTFSSTGSLTVSSATNSSFVPSPTTIIIARRVGSVVYLGVNATQMLLRDQESKLISDLGYLNDFDGGTKFNGQSGGLHFSRNRNRRRSNGGRGLSHGRQLGERFDSLSVYWIRFDGGHYGQLGLSCKRRRFTGLHFDCWFDLLFESFNGWRNHLDSSDNGESLFMPGWNGNIFDNFGHRSGSYGCHYCGGGCWFSGLRSAGDQSGDPEPLQRHDR